MAVTAIRDERRASSMCEKVGVLRREKDRPNMIFHQFLDVLVLVA